ncbi:MAG: hypothetical protein GOMPHAMPRED_007165 [Gomphillus americanus]|uniref:PLC-like phosphodiesterase n=1 Tax=Gomphillus americanus TaxID=1940652 RepID=A0A8H3I0Y7_9LECA|nr:MAG: hypothetical protein GOMPHAMPRED_007165 [Gomphillus americanus]
MYIAFFLLLAVGIEVRRCWASLALASDVASVLTSGEEVALGGANDQVDGTTVASRGMLDPASSLIGFSTVSTAVSAANPRFCNNYIEFCNRSYGNITEVCAHDSPFDVANNIASNQLYDVMTQLNDGVRMLQGQTHVLNGTLHFCHTSCALLDAGPVEAYFSNISAWLGCHPDEVVTILIVNGDSSPVADFVGPIQNSDLGRYVYTPHKIPMMLGDWPTLGVLIDNGARAVIFMDYGADQMEVPYILDEFSQLWETTFSPTNASFPCTVQRPSNLSFEQAESLLYLTNHNLNIPVDPSNPDIFIPDPADINRTNGVSGFGSLGLAAENCEATWNRPPNFLLVDYYNKGSPSPGSVFEVAASINGVSYTRTCCGSNTGTSSAASSPTSTAPSISSAPALATSGASNLVFDTLALYVVCMVSLSTHLLWS